MARRVTRRLQNRPFASWSRVRGEMNRLCGAGRVRAVGDRLKRSVPTAASRHERELAPPGESRSTSNQRDAGAGEETNSDSGGRVIA